MGEIWQGGPPTEVVSLDPCSPDIEIRHIISRDEQSRVVGAEIKLSHSSWGTLWSRGYAAAWARPRGSTEWPWVLIIWQDRYDGVTGPQEWMGAWVVYNKRHIAPVEADEKLEPRNEEEFERMSTALVEAIDALA